MVPAVKVFTHILNSLPVHKYARTPCHFQTMAGKSKNLYDSVQKKSDTYILLLVEYKGLFLRDIKFRMLFNTYAT